jgi:hypothetical protein
VRVFRLRFWFVSRIGSGGSGGRPDFPRGPGAGWVVPMSGLGGSGHGSGRVPCRPNRGSEMKDKLPRVRFCKVRVGPRDPRPTGCRMGGRDRRPGRRIGPTRPPPLLPHGRVGATLHGRSLLKHAHGVCIIPLDFRDSGLGVWCPEAPLPRTPLQGLTPEVRS